MLTTSNFYASLLEAPEHFEAAGLSMVEWMIASAQDRCISTADGSDVINHQQLSGSVAPSRGRVSRACGAGHPWFVSEFGARRLRHCGCSQGAHGASSNKRLGSALFFKLRQFLSQRRHQDEYFHFQ